MSKLAIREKYLERIRPFYDDELIKILVGIRRCGKSFLLKQIIDEIKHKGITDNHIVYYNFEDFENSDIENAKDLYAVLKKQFKDKKKYYLFFDEIQYVKNFEKVINSLRSNRNVSIFITGSNGKLLSNELSTILSGRYVKFLIQPFSFSEIVNHLKIKSNEKIETAFYDYLKWGGMPHRFAFSDEMSIRTYLNDVFDSIVKKDVIDRAGIKNTSLFDVILKYTVDIIGSLFSPQKVINYLNSQSRKISKDTLYTYLNAITTALILQKVDRYNLAGKEIMATISKYYASDIGIAQIKPSKNKVNLGGYLENIVYNELMFRNYDVYVGYLKNAEVDFVAIKDNKVSLFQVAAHLDTDEIIDREFGAFPKNINDVEKFVLSLDKNDMTKGDIVHKNIVKWLLEWSL